MSVPCFFVGAAGDTAGQTAEARSDLTHVSTHAREDIPMLRTNRFIVRTRLALAAGASLVSLAACSHDATAPTAASTELPVAAQLVDPARLTFFKKPKIGFSMKNQQGYPIPGATVTITGPNGFSMTIVDGGLNDQDGSNNGGLSNELPAAGTYQWCEITAPTGYAMPSPNCSTFDAKWNMIYIMIVTHPGWVVPSPTNPF
jgi:hypothetical protein